ncbi:UPF0193 protein EVG1-like [Penaeus chinensis]|uniref:UPF0193 protein EVG1-like n=1 Tax=Penaeus chinensis TaxID=139456 RepID=UPI001FB835BA|nr:UPF0193 protein EVG1-like [Penaeus chinensis]
MASTSRQNVASGGIFDLPRVTYSESTRQLLKDLLQEAAVSRQHQRYIERWVGSGGSLPRQEALAANSQDPHARGRPPTARKTPRPHIQAKRSHEAIKSLGLYAPNTHYVPPPPKYGPGSKERCQELMAYGREGVTTHPTPRRKARPNQQEPKTDRFSELVREMEERVHWLEAMEAVGAGDEYRPLIASQLALKLRDLELLDQERARDLARSMRISQAGNLASEGGKGGEEGGNQKEGGTEDATPARE